MDRPTIAIDLENLDFNQARHNDSVCSPLSPGSCISPGGTRRRKVLPKALELPQEDLLKDHAKNYKKHYDSFQREYNSPSWDIEGITQEINKLQIKCTKYNYSLEAEVQNSLTNEGIL